MMTDLVNKVKFAAGISQAQAELAVRVIDESQTIILLNILSPIIGLVIYFIVEWVLHATIASKAGIKKRTFDFSEIMSFSRKRILMILSIGYAFADYFKGEEKGDKRKDFIKKCNFYNFLISLFLMIFSWIAISMKFELILLILLFFNGFRFISRSFEIIFSFGSDAIDNTNAKGRSGLGKFERLKLAVISYFEIYIYSASFYMILLIHDKSDQLWLLKSILMSLFVGTLTNVAYIHEALGPSNWQQLLPFVQVFTTLSLVVLSLAAYVSRIENADANSK